MSEAVPISKKTIVFIDGQNLYHTAKEAFGRRDPDYDVVGLSRFVCSKNDWQLQQIRFYTGIPERDHKREWHDYWSSKLRSMSRRGVYTFKRHLRKRRRTAYDRRGQETELDVFEEKGIDVRIALDLVALAHKHAFDIAVIFSQDQDLSEAVSEVKAIAKDQERQLAIASAYPLSTLSKNPYGIFGTQHIPIQQEDYERYLDTWDYWKQLRR